MQSMQYAAFASAVCAKQQCNRSNLQLDAIAKTLEVLDFNFLNHYLVPVSRVANGSCKSAVDKLESTLPFKIGNHL